MHLKITRVNGAMKVAPSPPYLIDYLQYTHRGMEVAGFKKVNRFTKKLLHSIDQDGAIITFQGFFEIICKLIIKQGDTFEVEDLRTPLPQVNLQAIKDINWNTIGSVGPRDYQFEPIIKFLQQAQTNSGIVNATGGWGKTVMQAITYAAFNNLNTILAVPYKEVCKQTHEQFKGLFPHKHIGKIGGGHHELSKDITITTLASLKTCSTEKCELLLVDEIQATTGEKTLETLMTIHPIRAFGYTATDQNLFNNADKVIKGLFGERLIYIPYTEAEEDGAVVPCVVYIMRMPQVMITASSIEGKLMQGIKSCNVRNKLIGDICKVVPNNWQTIVFLDNIEDHLIKLYPELPNGTKFIHRGSSKKKLGSFALTDKQQKKIAEGFKENEFQFLLATDAFRAGVDVPNCRVIIQCAGGSSEIEVLQEAYRGSRTLSAAKQKQFNVEPKTHFVLVDFLDNHDETLENMALKRIEYYRKQGWKIKMVNSVKDIDWFDFEAVKKTL